MTIYADLLRYIAKVNWEDPKEVQLAITELIKTLESKLTNLDNRVTALE